MSRRQVEDFCRTNLGQYVHHDSVKKDLMQTVCNFKELSPSRGAFYESNGQHRDMVKLDGTIPVLYKGSSYNIPVCIWLDHQHPHRPPICMVVPTPTMNVRAGKHVDANGMIYLPYLREWRHPNSDIGGLIQVMQLQFGENCPVFAKPAASSHPSTPASHPPPPRPTQPYPGHPPGQAAAPYPGSGYTAPGSGATPYPSHQPAVGGYNSMPMPSQPARSPQGPQPPYPGTHGPTPYPSRQPGPRSQAPYPHHSGPTPQRSPYPSSGGQPYPSGGQPFPSSGAPYPGGPPQRPGYPTPSQPHQSTSGAGQAPYPGSSPYPGSQPPYPGTSSASTPYPGTCGPTNSYATYPPPQDVSSSSANPTSLASSRQASGGSIMSTVPAGYGGAMITEQLRGHRNNNDDGDLSSEKVHRDSLLSGVSDKLKRRMRNTKDAAEVEINDLQMQQHQLQSGSEKLDSIFTEIARLQAEADSNIAVLTTKSAELQVHLEKLDESASSEIDVDDAVIATYPLHTQIVNMIAEDNAIEDTLYYLGEALRKKVIKLDVFLKNVRELSTRQYILRATLQKADAAAQL